MGTADLTIDVPNVGAVSSLWQAPPTFKATLVLAHGAGANMTHRSMAAIADGLGDLGVASLRLRLCAARQYRSCRSC
jgi:predicted alpha/beta-hydrolase family hydrolase